jgi:hypothetical protein
LVGSDLVLKGAWVPMDGGGLTFEEDIPTDGPEIPEIEY